LAASRWPSPWPASLLCGIVSDLILTLGPYLITADEIKEFWHGFCERQGVGAEVRAKGDKRIEEDPEHWADQTMWDLLDALSVK
jgi:hypothetical protein